MDPTVRMAGKNGSRQIAESSRGRTVDRPEDDNGASRSVGKARPGGNTGIPIRPRHEEREGRRSLLELADNVRSRSSLDRDESSSRNVHALSSIPTHRNFFPAMAVCRAVVLAADSDAGR